MRWRWRWRFGRKKGCCCKNDGLLTLDELKVGEEARIVKILGNGAFKQRLLEMGFVPGTKVKVVRYAPLEDPVEYEVKGYRVALRREEAERVVVERC